MLSLLSKGFRLHSLVLVLVTRGFFLIFFLHSSSVLEGFLSYTPSVFLTVPHAAGLSEQLVSLKTSECQC